MILCYYDKKDFDGQASAAIVRYWSEKTNRGPLRLIPYGYGKSIDLESITEETTVFMVDISADPKVMFQLRARAKIFIWIDHHKSAIDRVNCNFAGVQDPTQAACVLTWKYLFKDRALPYAIRQFGSFDVWDHSDPDCVPFQYGARGVIDSVNSPLWDLLLEDNREVIDRILQQGYVVNHYRKEQNRIYCNARAFATQLDNYSVLACNVACQNSSFFDSANTENFDLLALFCLTPHGDWKVSIYSKAGSGIDVSKIALKRGGGGHKHAAGYKSPHLPFHPLSVI